MKTLGWIGTGHMGVPMAKNLLKAGFKLNIYNRSPEKAASLVKEGATQLKTPGEIVSQSDIIFLMLTSGASITDVLTQQDGILAAIKPGKVVIDMSTIAPGESHKNAQIIAGKGGIYFDAPVSGSVGAAETAQLVILAGAAQQAADDYQSYFDALGKKTIYFGGIGSGSSAKLVINLLLAITAQGAAEALVFGEKFGLGLEDVLEMITHSAVNTPLFQMKKDMFRSGQFPAAFMLELMSKDLRLIKAEADRMMLKLPLETVTHDTFQQAEKNGMGKLDVAAVYLEVHESNDKKCAKTNI